MTPFRRILVGAALGSALAGVARVPRAWPAGPQRFDRPVRIIVPFPAGSVTDTLFRNLVEPLSQALRQTVVLENRGGGFGVVGMQAAQIATDNHTLVVTTVTTTSVNPVTVKSLPYDPMRDFTHIGFVAETPYILVVPPTSPAQDMQGFLRLMKARSGDLTYSYGNASAQIASSTLARAVGATMTAIPYRGGAEAMTDVLTGRVDSTFTDVTNGLEHIRLGKLRALGVSSSQPTPLAPEIPPIGSAVPGFGLTVWFGLSAPASLSAALAEHMAQALNGVLGQSEVQAALLRQGYTTRPMSPAQYTAFVREEMVKWGDLARAAGLQAS
jgi:tripartite-type tricarboxylate transporter receptor subunit TctC